MHNSTLQKILRKSSRRSSASSVASSCHSQGTGNPGSIASRRSSVANSRATPLTPLSLRKEHSLECMQEQEEHVRASVRKAEAARGDRELKGRWAVDDGGSEGGGGDTDRGQGAENISDDDDGSRGGSSGGIDCPSE